MERYIAVDNVCAWPHLTLMDDGSLNLEVNNAPNHRCEEGGAECWKSTDGGRFFKKVGSSCQGAKKEGTSFADKACGVAHNGDYIVIVLNRDYCNKTDDKAAYIFRSKDGGKTYEQTGRMMYENRTIVPCDQIRRLSDSTLAVVYWTPIDRKKYPEKKTSCEARVRFSYDDGYTWDEKDDYLIGERINETSVLFYDNGEVVAVGRTEPVELIYDGSQSDYNYGYGNLVYRSKDGGKTWKFENTLLGHEMWSVNLLQLADGSTLLTSSIRFPNYQAIIVCISKDKGKTWYAPNVLVEYPGVDGGCPISAQIKDGTIVTAYYSIGNMYHTRYHAGIIRWKLDELIENRWIDDRGPVQFYYGTNKEHKLTWRIN